LIAAPVTVAHTAPCSIDFGTAARKQQIVLEFLKITTTTAKMLTPGTAHFLIRKRYSERLFPLLPYIDLVACRCAATSSKNGGRSALDGDNESRVIC